MKLMSRAQAIQYILGKLDSPWGNPASALSYHIQAGNIRPSSDGQFSKKELNRFCKRLNRTARPQQPSKILPQNMEKLLGTMSDQALAARAGDGWSAQKIGAYRTAKGIAPWGIGICPELRPLLGIAPDQLIERLSREIKKPVSRLRIARARRKDGIPPYRHRGGPSSVFDPKAAKGIVSKKIYSILEKMLDTN